MNNNEDVINSTPESRESWHYELIGRVKQRFDELSDKQFQWHSFYHGWLEGRFDMKKAASTDSKEEELQAEWEFLQIIKANYEIAKRGDGSEWKGYSAKKAVLETYDDLFEIIKGLPLKRSEKPASTDSIAFTEWVNKSWAQYEDDENIYHEKHRVSRQKTLPELYKIFIGDGKWAKLNKQFPGKVDSKEAIGITEWKDSELSKVYEKMKGDMDRLVELETEVIKLRKYENAALKLAASNAKNNSKEAIECLKELIPLAESGLKLHISNAVHQEFIKEDKEVIKNAKECLYKLFSPNEANK